jgi:hypothetical protein
VVAEPDSSVPEKKMPLQKPPAISTWSVGKTLIWKAEIENPRLIGPHHPIFM